MNARGHYGNAGGMRRTTFVGAHTIEEQYRLVRQIDASFTALATEMYQKMGVDPRAALDPSQLFLSSSSSSRADQEATLRQSPLYPLWRDAVVPLWAAWVSFRDKTRRGTWGEFLTSWEEFTDWGSRVARLHDYLASQIPSLLPGESLRGPKPFIGVQVGLTLFHGTADRDGAAAQIDTQLMAIVSALLGSMGADASVLRTFGAGKTPPPDLLQRVVESREAIKKSPNRALWEDTVSPLFNEWNSFYGDRQHWYDVLTKQFTSWEDYLSWANRVNALRDRVEAAGIKISMPRLQAFSKSLQEKAEETASSIASGVGDVWKIVKYGAIGALGIGAIIALSSLASNLRSGRDPAERYVDVYRRRSRAALPASTQLMLPPGEEVPA